MSDAGERWLAGLDGLVDDPTIRVMQIAHAALDAVLHLDCATCEVCVIAAHDALTKRLMELWERDHPMG